MEPCPVLLVQTTSILVLSCTILPVPPTTIVNAPVSTYPTLVDCGIDFLLADIEIPQNM